MPKTYEDWMRFAHVVKAEAQARGLGALERQAHALEGMLASCERDAASPLWLDLKDAQRALLGAYLRESTAAVPADPVPLAERVRRSVETLAMELGREVRFEWSGEFGTLPPEWSEPLYSALLAAVRNCVDHGAALKGELRITLEVRRSPDRRFELELRDAGVGIDPSAVRAIVVEKGLCAPAALAALPDDEILQLLFMPGLSLKRRPTRLSGRGFGLDIVRDAVEGLGGRARLRSRLGEGTSLLIELSAPESARAAPRSA